MIASYTAGAFALVTYISQPSSPTYESRTARTVTPATSMSRTLPYGKATLPRSARVTRASDSRERGPISDSVEYSSVTSVRVTLASCDRLRRIQSKSLTRWPLLVTTKNVSGAMREIVRSLS